MSQRFILFTFAACVVMFAVIFAVSAPASAPVAAPTAAAPVVLYADCDAARLAGAAPLRAGQPGYRPALDGNMNGIACEAVGVADALPTPAAATVADPQSMPEEPVAIAPPQPAPMQPEPAPGPPPSIPAPFSPSDPGPLPMGI